MKNLLIMLCIILGSQHFSFAQQGSGFGIKGGLNYSSNGNYSSSLGEFIAEPESHTGFHLGVFGKFGSSIYLKFEPTYTQTHSSYNTSDFKTKKVDVPALIGVQLIGPFGIFAGPALQYIIESELDGIAAEARSEDITTGLNFGIAFNFKTIGVDLRYERGLEDYEFDFITNNDLDVVTIDSRPEQLILSVSIQL
ncbi:outer membrane beta-barrel protein [Formosa sediminum]|uniref:Outer membrane beta-barrel protein n=1 Tax=Formosa sediminum TaxID=2594004 RepID=A0A516GRM4_9FLAO|nr:outer membrane beta-barrel protein [Formosa sediminum]QDO94159.1 outer membrane beta-barrel protein [Formosa sediminum]